MATMPPTIQSASSAKPELMSLTWNPRLVKTPTPTMSATTIDVAVSQVIRETDARPEMRSVINLQFPTLRHYKGRRRQIDPNLGLSPPKT